MRDAPSAPVRASMSLVQNHLDPLPPTFASAPIPDGSNCGWNCVSLFSGGGGLDLGFLGQGMRTTAAYDNSRNALETHARNLPSEAWLADLNSYTPNDRCDIMLAGAPCQGFSTAGRRALSDPRNALLRRVADIFVEARPKVLVVENVPAALSGAHGELWRALEDRVRLTGYQVARLKLQGEDSGIAQRRRRLFLLAWRGNECVRVAPDKLDAPSLRSTFAGLDGTQGHFPVMLDDDDPRSIVADAIPPGGKLSNVRQGPNAVPTWAIARVFGETTSAQRDLLVAVSRLRRRARRRTFGDGDPVAIALLMSELERDVAEDVEALIDAGFLKRTDGHIDLKSTYNGRFRRLRWDQPSPTVDTRFGRPDLFLHPDRNRGMTLREAARIQGFPDSYVLPSKASVGFEIVGNAVPPPMAARLGVFVREALLKA